jgi:hypothetical protein
LSLDSGAIGLLLNLCFKTLPKLSQALTEAFPGSGLLPISAVALSHRWEGHSGLALDLVKL